MKKLSDTTGVGTASIVRCEELNGIPPSRKDNLLRIKQAFENEGIEFIGTPDDAPGIRILRK